MRQQRRTHSQDSIDELPREWIVLNPVAAARHTLANWRLFGSINDESVQRVLNYLDGRSLAAASQVCKHLRWMASDDAMWLQACRAEWGVCPHHLSKTQDPLGGKELYFFATQSMRALTLHMLQEQCLLSLQTTLQRPVAHARVAPMPHNA
ncbi:hypothetical protein H310_04058 [Aphanomyces invadans]|uniref:F-box domain-containing protein n=1 Tax=Aphanomyces invadans TaxID=157072 RepID=A0A024UFM2_9STRA|nr:hypothetical protein H310_04058 [Aphanomyces invadans]ETW04990.1 hypothetical protein H310_04058 [Aphanomyces invadans]|eukprot:XP_008866429.1 hypothetical protein H310_04058 [Aphanomyces invadans]